MSKKLQLRIQVLKNLNRFLGPESFKKSQLRIQEMAFMLLAVFLFFILVGLFVTAIFYTNIKERASEIAEERTLSSLTNLADSPEFSCSATKTNCIDGDKLITLINKTVYQNFWPYSSLKVITLDGFGKSESELLECNFANYPDCNLFKIYKKEVEDERVISSFAVICRKKNENGVYDRCDLAKLIAGTELKSE